MANPLELIPESVAGKAISPLVTAYLASAISCARRAAVTREQAITRYDTPANYGMGGPVLRDWLSAGIRPHWPAPVKDQIRSAEHARTRFLDAAAKQWRAERRRAETLRRVVDQLRAGGY